jgi:hypothetical protein
MEVLALNHVGNPFLIFSPALWRVGADFPSVGVSSYRSIQDGFVVLGELRTEFELRDRAAPVHDLILPIARRAISPRCSQRLR